MQQRRNSPAAITNPVTLTHFHEYDSSLPRSAATDGLANTQQFHSNDGLTEDEPPSRGWARFLPPIRYVLSFMGFIGFMFVYAMRVNLSIAIVAMIDSIDDRNHSTSSLLANNSNGQQCEAPNNGNDTHHTPGEFHWDEHTKSQVLAAFFYGYACTQLLGGYLASRFGAARVFFVGVLVTSLLTLVTPVAARASPWLLLAIRVCEGLFSGVTYPSSHVLWSYWAPIHERSRLVAFMISGCFFGTLVAIPVSSTLANQYGWPSVFYVIGGASCVWSILWLAIAADRPSKHWFITQKERKFIEEHLDRADQHTNQQQSAASTATTPLVAKRSHPSAVPWLQFAKTPAVWALCLGHTGTAWGIYAYITELPTYMNNVLKFSLTANGFLSALPYAAMFLAQNISATIADMLRNRGYNLTIIRKVFQSLASFIPALLLVLLPTAGCNHAGAVALLVLALGFTGCMNGGFFANHVDIGSEYAGILMGISNTFGSITGFIAPLVAGYTAGDAKDQTFQSWAIFFYISAALYFLTGVGYLFTASAERLPWLDEFVERQQQS